MKFEHGSPRRTLSKHDRNLRQTEMEDAVQEDSETIEEYEAMFNDIDKVLQKYFPEDFANFQRPDQWRYQRTYNAALNHFYPEGGWDKRTEDYYDESAFWRLQRSDI